MFWSCYFIQNAFLRSFFLTNLVKTEVGFKWRINLEALENNLSEVSGFPTDFPHQEFYGKTLFVGGAKSDYVRWVLPRNYCKILKTVSLDLSLVFKNAPDHNSWVVTTFHSDNFNPLCNCVVSTSDCTNLPNVDSLDITFILGVVVSQLHVWLLVLSPTDLMHLSKPFP